MHKEGFPVPIAQISANLMFLAVQLRIPWLLSAFEVQMRSFMSELESQGVTEMDFRWI